MMKAYRTGSGYYVDVGASQLIIDGEIGVRGRRRDQVADAGRHPASTTAASSRPTRSSVAPAIQSMHETVAKIVSREVADKVGTCWGLGSGTRDDPGPWHGELRNMWKPIAQEACGSRAAIWRCRASISKFVALQIKARMEGIETPVYGKMPALK